MRAPAQKLFTQAKQAVFSELENNPEKKTLTIHGKCHASRVAINITLLLNLRKSLGERIAVPSDDFDCLITAALFHDIARTNDGVDVFEKKSEQDCFEFMIGQGIDVKRAERFAKLISTKDHPDPKLKKSWHEYELYRSLLHDADSLDIMRVHRFEATYLECYKLAHKTPAHFQQFTLFIDQYQLWLANMGDLLGFSDEATKNKAEIDDSLIHCIDTLPEPLKHFFQTADISKKYLSNFTEIRLSASDEPPLVVRALSHCSRKGYLDKEFSEAQKSEGNLNRCMSYVSGLSTSAGRICLGFDPARLAIHAAAEKDIYSAPYDKTISFVPKVRDQIYQYLDRLNKLGLCGNTTGEGESIFKHNELNGSYLLDAVKSLDVFTHSFTIDGEGDLKLLRKHRDYRLAHAIIEARMCYNTLPEALRSRKIPVKFYGVGNHLLDSQPNIFDDATLADAWKTIIRYQHPEGFRADSSLTIDDLIAAIYPRHTSSDTIDLFELYSEPLLRQVLDPTFYTPTAPTAPTAPTHISATESRQNQQLQARSILKLIRNPDPTSLTSFTHALVNIKQAAKKLDDFVKSFGADNDDYHELSAQVQRFFIDATERFTRHEVSGIHQADFNLGKLSDVVHFLKHAPAEQQDGNRTTLLDTWLPELIRPNSSFICLDGINLLIDQTKLEPDLFKIIKNKLLSLLADTQLREYTYDFFIDALQALAPHITEDERSATHACILRHAIEKLFSFIQQTTQTGHGYFPYDKLSSAIKDIKALSDGADLNGVLSHDQYEKLATFIDSKKPRDANSLDPFICIYIFRAAKLVKQTGLGDWNSDEILARVPLNLHRHDYWDTEQYSARAFFRSLDPEEQKIYRDVLFYRMCSSETVYDAFSDKGTPQALTRAVFNDKEQMALRDIIRDRLFMGDLLSINPKEDRSDAILNQYKMLPAKVQANIIRATIKYFDNRSFHDDVQRLSPRQISNFANSSVLFFLQECERFSLAPKPSSHTPIFQIINRSFWLKPELIEQIARHCPDQFNASAVQCILSNNNWFGIDTCVPSAEDIAEGSYVNLDELAGGVEQVCATISQLNSTAEKTKLLQALMTRLLRIPVTRLPQLSDFEGPQGFLFMEVNAERAVPDILQKLYITLSTQVPDASSRKLMRQYDTFSNTLLKYLEQGHQAKILKIQETRPLYAVQFNSHARVKTVAAAHDSGVSRLFSPPLSTRPATRDHEEDAGEIEYKATPPPSPSAASTQ